MQESSFELITHADVMKGLLRPEGKSASSKHVPG